MAKIQNRKAYLREQLAVRYESSEADHIARQLLEHHLGLPYPQLILNDIDVTKESPALEESLARLLRGEPLQYILGQVHFFGLALTVAPGVLIPRPETEELCQLITQHPRFQHATQVADIGTGSGCIAIALAKASNKIEVEAIDISHEALSIAKRNIELCQVERQVTTTQADIFAETFRPRAREYSLIVSNPPYVLESEAVTMEEHVLRHEPPKALFVPDNDGARYYHKIIEIYHHRLSHTGMIAFEINPLLSQEISLLGEAKGLLSEVRQDMQGRDRFIFLYK